MARQSERLEQETKETRARLAGAVDELRLRLTPGEVVDQVSDYVRDGPAADFFHNLVRQIRENPIPVVLIATGIGWLMIASARSPRPMAAFDRDVRLVTGSADTAAAYRCSGRDVARAAPEELTPLGA